ncbi:MAG: methylated-DNA--[protein]-cysteine S-methyltransferase [Planctomycetes bacterium]|nr:methylated-DNA--[protein]-cysteine S-methyltransferase [Planctomycetota bacterium]
MSRREDALLCFDTPLGSMRARWGPSGLQGLSFASRRPRRGSEAEAPPALRRLARRVVEHLRGRPQDFRDVPLDLEAMSPFRRSVFRALREVAPGTVITYGELAARAGRPGAARAVGAALAANPVCLVVPCHRVVGAGGRLVGFSAPGGMARKRRLLELEGVLAT